jgi:glycosyltransferase involved in cell wall biosynthesis
MDDASISQPSQSTSGDQRPLVSVLLPVFNAEKYLAAAIDSILRQTFRDLELIIIDDGSVDGSSGIIAACTDARLVVIRNETNLGVVASLNKGLALARGDLIARMDADDVADLRRIEQQVAYCLRNSNVAALGTAITYIDDDGTVTGHPGRLALEPAVVRWRLLRGTCLFHPTLMLNRARAGDDVRYSAEFVHAEDYELMLRLSRRYDLDNLPERLLGQRLHAGAVSVRFRELQRESAARALAIHARQRYGLDIAAGQALTLLDPRYFFDRSNSDANSPVGLILQMQRCFLSGESGLTRENSRAVRRDVAFFLWKLAAIAAADWSAGVFPLRRLRTLASCAAALAVRPRAALAALAWR